MSDYIEERTYYPTGCEPDDRDAFPFSVKVTWRGRGKWSVNRGSAEQLSSTGRWLWMPLKMTAMRWCRFSFEDACTLAEAHVDGVKVNGRTWAEWEAHFGREVPA